MDKKQKSLFQYLTCNTIFCSNYSHFAQNPTQINLIPWLVIFEMGFLEKKKPIGKSPETGVSIEESIQNVLIEDGKAEFTFTFYYSLGGPLKSVNSSTDTPEIPGIEFRQWHKSELSHYISENFIGKLIINHFHITPPQDLITVDIPEAWSPYGEKHCLVFPNIFLKANNDGPHKSIAAAECTIFKNGYLSVILRLNNHGLINIHDVLELIKHPEFVEYEFQKDDGQDHPKGRFGLSCGPLITEIWSQMGSYFEPKIQEVLKRLNLEELNFKTGAWCKFEWDRIERRKNQGEISTTNTSKEQIKQQTSLEKLRRPPYVGIFFSLDHLEIIPSHTETPSSPNTLSREIIERFVIAAGRVTPSFLYNFNNPHEYLSSENRNVYGQGNSIVFIGRRAWCVFDCREQNYDAFRLGVIETAHFVITVIQTSALTHRRFSIFAHEEGSKIFQDLNLAITNMFKSKTIFLGIVPNYFKKCIAKGTSFLARARLVSPCEDMASLLESYLTSQTGQAALKRCQNLTGLEHLAGISREMMASYTSFLKTSSDYLEPTFRTSRAPNCSFSTCDF